MSKIILHGITWGHSRGITPLLAASQRFNEIYPDVEIQWKKRSLQEFADFPIEKLTGHYDLLIIDHPWVGCAADTKCVLALDQHLPSSFLMDQQQHSIGQSHPSYIYGGHQWGLAIDAATPVASYRAELFEQHKQRLPATWEDVLELATQGKVAVPAIPIDLLMNFYMFCIALGHEPFQNEEAVIAEEVGMEALQTMVQLYRLVNKQMFSLNPIGVAELMSSIDQYWYCPFAYGYSNYSRSGYAKHLLHYADLVKMNGAPLSSTLGGTGLSISADCKHPDVALQFAQMVTGGAFQSTFYVEHGGQPGHRKAWTNEAANALTNNYFKNTLPTLDRAYVRPRYNGYLFFQDHAGEPLQRFLMNGGDPVEVLAKMNELYKHSLSLALNIV